MLKRTPRTDMYYDALIYKLAEFWDDLAASFAKDEGIDMVHLDRVMSLYLRMSVRCELDGKADFELAQPSDTAEQVKEKFLAFLNSENMELIDEAAEALGHKAFLGNPVTAPDAKVSGKN